MPCQCGTAGGVGSDAVAATLDGCGCETESAAGCECGSGGSPPAARETSLERLVMELDKRVRKLEAKR